MKPRWVEGLEYYDTYRDHSDIVVLSRRDWANQYLIAGKWYVWLKLYYKSKIVAIKARNMSLRWAHKRGIIKIDYSEMVTFHTLRKWFIAARKG